MKKLITTIIIITFQLTTIGNYTDVTAIDYSTSPNDNLRPMAVESSGLQEAFFEQDALVEVHTVGSIIEAINQQGIGINIVCEESLLVRCDFKNIVSALSNIVSNAKDFAKNLL